MRCQPPGSGRWEWDGSADGDSSAFANWAPGEPNNWQGGADKAEDCAVMYRCAPDKRC